MDKKEIRIVIEDRTGEVHEIEADNCICLILTADKAQGDSAVEATGVKICCGRTKELLALLVELDQQKSKLEKDIWHAITQKNQG